MIATSIILRRVADLHLSRVKSEAVMRLIADLVDTEQRPNVEAQRPNLEAQFGISSGSSQPNSAPNAPELPFGETAPLPPQTKGFPDLPKENSPPNPIDLERRRAKAVSKIGAQLEAQLSAEFDSNFWPSYPHRVDRPDAFRAFIRARTGERVRGKPARQPASLATIMAGLDRYVANKPEGREYLNPATFLNQERFNDEPAAAAVQRSRNGLDALGSALALVAQQIEENEEPDREIKRISSPH